MPSWIILVGLGGLVLALVVFALRRGTLYIFKANGYRAISARRSVMHHTNRDGLALAVRNLLDGATLDMLWVSHTNDEYGGLVVVNLDGVVDLSVSFKAVGEQEKFEDFKEALEHLGKPFSIRSGYNGGWEEEHLEVSVEIELAREPGAVVEAVEIALHELQGESDEYYLTGHLAAIRFARRSGIWYQLDRDPLKKVLLEGSNSLS